ncbi:hypothetical protein PV08_11485 [Exophiala spinifera]|uniref:Uncharacterized protein n=1 Tax=Exophiala spinifera TaxID=91928 RepID=A0A0D1Y6P0_9EURO|nr:uncharacterized protein PV08_11485 [Exophiala spinifera]KIW10521.1 hypothetical protein PV08_11485 [Exophiala spinifera]
MVCVVGGLVAAAPATLPAGVASSMATAAVASSGTIVLGEGVSIGATVIALGEGACVGVGTLGGGSSAGIAFATLVGPVGWAIVGCSKNKDDKGDSGYTWDCWKPVVRDMSTRPSCGMTLHCLAAHPNVQSLWLDQGRLFVENNFGERFRLAPVSVEGVLAFHASILSSNA